MSETRPAILLQEARRQMDRAFAEMDLPAIEHVVPRAGAGAVDAFLGKIVAVNLRANLVLVAPLLATVDPAHVDGQGHLAWDSAASFDMEAIVCAWSGVWTGPCPGDPTICQRVANCRRWIAIPIYNLTGEVPLEGSTVGPSGDNLSAEYRFEEPAAEGENCDLAPADACTVLGPADWTGAIEEIEKCTPDPYGE